MLKSIRQFFDTNIQSVSGGHRSESPERAIQLATASLLIEVSRADFHLAGDEKDAILKAVGELFNLSRQETHDLLTLAESEIEGSTCLYEFTRLVNEYFNYEQKLDVIKNMWRVAYADLHRDKYEEHVIRKVCDLIHVSHSDFIRLKHEASTN